MHNFLFQNILNIYYWQKVLKHFWFRGISSIRGIRAFCTISSLENNTDQSRELSNVNLKPKLIN